MHRAIGLRIQPGDRERPRPSPSRTRDRAHHAQRRRRVSRDRARESRAGISFGVLPTASTTAPCVGSSLRAPQTTSTATEKRDGRITRSVTQDAEGKIAKPALAPLCAHRRPRARRQRSAMGGSHAASRRTPKEVRESPRACIDRPVCEPSALSEASPSRAARSSPRTRRGARIASRDPLGAPPRGSTHAPGAGSPPHAPPLPRRSPFRPGTSFGVRPRASTTAPCVGSSLRAPQTTSTATEKRDVRVTRRGTQDAKGDPCSLRLCGPQPQVDASREPSPHPTQTAAHRAEAVPPENQFHEEPPGHTVVVAVMRMVYEPPTAVTGANE